MLIGNKNIEAPRWICALLVICGIMAYFVTATVDVLYAVSTAIDSVGMAVKAAGMCLLSGFAIGFASFAGFRFRAQHHVSGLMVLALAVLFMSFSMHNGIRYVGGQSIAKAKLTEASRQQSIDIAYLQNQQAIETQNWLRRDLPTDQGQGGKGQTACACCRAS
jgi:hypothetical protein